MKIEQPEVTGYVDLPGDNAVHLWILDLTRPEVCHLQDDSLLLTEQEWLRAARRAVPSDRIRFKLARTLVRSVLSHYCPTVAPLDWEFRTSGHGKPEISDPCLTRPVYFNVSHARQRLVMAVSHWPAIGVDVEWADPARDVEGIASRYFTQDELFFLGDLAPASRLAGFYTLWTLKEAFSKSRGLALVPSLRDVSFRMTGKSGLAAAIRERPDRGNLSGDSWQFWSYLDDSYLLAVALNRGRDEQAGIRARCLPRQVWNPLAPGQWQESGIVLHRHSG